MVSLLQPLVGNDFNQRSQAESEQISTLPAKKRRRCSSRIWFHLTSYSLWEYKLLQIVRCRCTQLIGANEDGHWLVWTQAVISEYVISEVREGEISRWTRNLISRRSTRSSYQTGTRYSALRERCLDETRCSQSWDVTHRCRLQQWWSNTLASQQTPKGTGMLGNQFPKNSTILMCIWLPLLMKPDEKLEGAGYEVFDRWP